MVEESRSLAAQRERGSCQAASIRRVPVSFNFTRSTRSSLGFDDLVVKSTCYARVESRSIDLRSLSTAVLYALRLQD